MPFNLFIVNPLCIFDEVQLPEGTSQSKQYEDELNEEDFNRFVFRQLKEHFLMD